jgi:hypothetical protein
MTELLASERANFVVFIGRQSFDVPSRMPLTGRQRAGDGMVAKPFWLGI